ncbi:MULTISPECIES: DMT family transporter [Yersinia]|uniref:Threonine/homoserine exporter RhtA n=1 Tax=Yersinia intermedia TaxID=631 RepID=A0A0H5MGU2_YERIN|nr:MULTISPECIES: DMT family transporter [Yersinia]MCB5309891.1 DMT family transporter [Yersinia massiliensis]CRY56286.1 integral membrane protein [Yersinia intermedia]
MNKSLVLLCVVLSTFFWGSNFNVAALIVNHVSPMMAATERFVIASIAILAILFLRERNNWVVLKRNYLAFILLGLCGITGFNLAFFIGLQTTTPINGALIMATSPITTALLFTLSERQKISRIQCVGMLVSLLGVLLVISKGSIGNLLNMQFNQGDMIILLGNIAWAAYTVGCRKYSIGATPLQITSFTMLFGTLGIVLFAYYTEGTFSGLSNISAFNHAALIYMGIAGSVLAYLFWNVGIKNLGAANTAVFFNLVPVFTMILAMLNNILPTGLQISGAVLVIAGVIFATQSYKLFYRSKPLITPPATSTPPSTGPVR